MEEPSELFLCKEDTTDEECAELIKRGFILDKADEFLLYFQNPYGKIDMFTYSDTYYDGPRVRIIIDRGPCWCHNYHKCRYPGTWNYSRVGFDNVPPRAAPEQPPETQEDRDERAARRERFKERRAELHEKAANGYMATLEDAYRNLRNDANKAVLDALLTADKIQKEKYDELHELYDL